jgi:hypothetical protein
MSDAATKIAASALRTFEIEMLDPEAFTSTLDPKALFICDTDYATVIYAFMKLSPENTKI